MSIKQSNRRQIVQQWAPFILIGLLLLLAPFVLSEFRLNLLGKFLTFAIVV